MFWHTDPRNIWIYSLLINCYWFYLWIQENSKKPTQPWTRKDNKAYIALLTRTLQHAREIATGLQKWTTMSAHKLVRVKGRRRPLLPVIEYCITGGRGTHFPTVMTFRSGAVVVYRVCADPLADSATNLTPLVTTIMMMMIMIRTHICTCDKWSTLSR